MGIVCYSQWLRGKCDFWAQKDSRTTIPLLTLCRLCCADEADWIMYRSIYYIFSLALIPWCETINVKRAVDLQQEACSVLENHEVYSSVKVAIGNPPQLFDLVADTGSDNCIVNDCSCKQCPKAWGSCFTGPQHSNSFRLPLFKVPVKVLYSPKLSVHMWGCKSNTTATCMVNQC